MKSEIISNKEFAKNLEIPTKKFAVTILKMCGKLPRNNESFVLRHQIAKSGTSIGANYREANRSRSKADFRNKIMICEGEASETQYWLEIISEMNFYKNLSEFQDIYKECSEILAIFTSIGKN